MEAWLIVLGAGLAMISGVLTELFRTWRERKSKKEDRRINFQREHVLKLHESHPALNKAVGKAYFVHWIYGSALPDGRDPVWMEVVDCTQTARMHLALVTDSALHQLATETVHNLNKSAWTKNRIESDQYYQLGQSQLKQCSERVNLLMQRL